MKKGLAALVITSLLMGTVLNTGMAASKPDSKASEAGSSISVMHNDDQQVIKTGDKNRIKVGIVDSGVDYSEDIRVKKAKNFVDEYVDKGFMFSDLSGHGTAVAGVIAANTEGKTQGINPDALIYSADVLDEQSTSTVDRLVEGIDWLIREKVNIINISCGTDKDSEKLHSIIKKAYNQGILLIAAAGKGDKISYPAKYKEVVAVGAVDDDGVIISDSPSGPEIEVVAPGKDVTTYGSFGDLCRVSGTSISAPYVSGLASLLWQKYPDRSAGFIRQLLRESAKPLGDACHYGYGLVDRTAALDKYDDVLSKYDETTSTGSSYDESSLNTSDTGKVRGFWSLVEHEGVVVFNSQILKEGAIWPDNVSSSVEGMVENPEFHGLYRANYVKSSIYISKVASILSKTGKFPKAHTKFEKKVEKAAKKGFELYKLKEKKDKSLFVYGMAIHAATDVFAHSSTGVAGKTRNALYKKSVKKLVKSWKRIKHGPRDPATGGFYPKTNMADDNICIPRRYKIAAKKTCNWILKKAVLKNRAATTNMYSNIKWYKSISEIKKYGNSKSDIKKKKAFLIQSFGVIKLEKYLKGASSRKVKAVAENLADSNIRGVIKKWAKD